MSSCTSTQETRHYWSVLRQDRMGFERKDDPIRIVFYCKNCLETQVHTIGFTPPEEHKHD